MTASRFDGPSDAPVVVLSNSLGTTLAMWEPQVAALSPRFGVLRYDHPGHGSSRDSPPARSAEALARGVLGLLDERGLERVSFCGLSLGGVVGMWLAMHAPERIDRLVLACTSARFGTRENWLARAATVRAEGMEAIADAVLRLWFTPRTHRDAAGTRRRLPRDDDLGRAARGTRDAARRSATGSPETELATIRAPTLVLAGGEDPATPPASGAEIAGRIPGARMSILEGAGHLANLEEPAAFNRLLLDHLTTRPAVEVA